MAIDTRSVQAIAAYKEASRYMAGGGQATPKIDPHNLASSAPLNISETHQARPASFLNMVRHSLERSIADQHQAELAAKKGIAGRADIAEVVAAVSAAELTLETVVTLRDKVIQAYQDIIRMPI